ncbi:MAG: tetratricopeptide repeat protein [Longimicrobiales bacterium]
MRFPTTSATCAVLLLAGCGADQSEAASEGATTEVATDPLASPQAVSLFGEDLYAQPDTSGQVAEADLALAGAPDDVELLIAAARVRRNVWQYRQAMELYTKAMELAPDDWRPYRYRGHRHISVREFDQAVVDLEEARERAPLNWDVSYHLGLAYFLVGEFGDAADEYLRCMDMNDDADAQAAQADDFRSCSQNAEDPESRVAMTEWAVRALLRDGRSDEAQTLLDGIPEDLPISVNVAYYHDLLFYKGLKTEEELLNPPEDGPYRLETVGMGVANWHIAHGEPEQARDILEVLVADPWWPGFGRIAAEVELSRLP